MVKCILFACSVLVGCSGCSGPARLEPVEFCEEFVAEACSALVACGDPSYEDCVEQVSGRLPECSTWTVELCSPGLWSGPNAAKCAGQIHEVSCEHLELGLLPKYCNHICIER